MNRKTHVKIADNISPEFVLENAVDIDGGVKEGRLGLTFAYNKAEFDKKSMEKFAAAYKNNLLKIIDHCVEKKREIEKLGLSAVDYHIQKAHEKYIEKVNNEQWLDLTVDHEYKHILLTGATGYLGAYLARQLIDSTEATIYLPVRGTSQEQAVERLKKKLDFYFGDNFFNTHKSRIEVLCSDLRKDLIGIGETSYEKLSVMVEVVVHSAANVKHYGAYEEFYQDNVLGTERLLEFALNQKKKDFHFVSTVDVGRGDIPGKDYLLFTEYCLDEGQQSPFVYGKSKFEAEKKVVAYREKGLNTSIYRAGNMTFNSQTGKFQENIHDNFTYSMMKTLIKVGFWSDRMRNLQLDLSFVDLAARAIVLLLTRKSLKNEIYHISNPNTMSWLEMASQLEKSGIEVQELKEHRNHVAKFESDSELGKLVERVKLYSWIWEESETRTVPRGVRTVALLNQIGFQWPEVSTQHLEKMIDHCKNVGFL